MSSNPYQLKNGKHNDNKPKVLQCIIATFIMPNSNTMHNDNYVVDIMHSIRHNEYNNYTL